MYACIYIFLSILFVHELRGMFHWTPQKSDEKLTAFAGMMLPWRCELLAQQIQQILLDVLQLGEGVHDQGQPQGVGTLW